MTFNEYLMEKYVEIEHPLDDMIPDGFESWLCDLDPADIMEWADLFAQKENLRGQREMLKEISDAIPNLEEELK